MPTGLMSFPVFRDEWAHLGLNQGPSDYESDATNQLSYRPETSTGVDAFVFSPCRDSVKDGAKVCCFLYKCNRHGNFICAWLKSYHISFGTLMSCGSQPYLFQPLSLLLMSRTVHSHRLRKGMRLKMSAMWSRLSLPRACQKQRLPLISEEGVEDFVYLALYHSVAICSLHFSKAKMGLFLHFSKVK